MRQFLRALILTLTLLVTACPRLPGLLPQTGSSVAAQADQVAAIQGQVDFSVPGRTVQADIGTEIAKGATVSLIETGTGYTVATTVTNADGTFKLAFANGWKPTPSAMYYLEAVKGLSAGKSLPNRVGADLARVRTIISWLNNQWTCLSGSSINLNPTSTALSIIHSLRSMTPPPAGRQINAADMLGILGTVPGTATTPTPFTYTVSLTSSLMPASMVTDAYLIVLDALSKDSDPFRAAVLDTNDALYNRILNVPKVVSLASLYPNVQAIGASIDLIGSGFSATPSQNVVEFSDVAGGPIPAAVATVSADLARLTVTVPSGAVTGPVAVTVGGRKMIGPTFYLALQSGHEALDTSGNLYVANESFGTIAKITPQGQISTWVTGLTNPRALTIRNTTMYVTCAGTTTGIVSLDLTNAAAAPVNVGQAGLVNADPRGIAFDATGRLYVSHGNNNTIYRFDLTAGTGTSLITSGLAPSNPRGIAFGPDGRLYVASYGDNQVLAVNVTTGASSTFKQGFTSPWGLAFDSVGNMYVSNNKGDSIYRWKKDTDTLAPYADVPSPGGLVTDRGGYVYALDNTANNLYRITPLGDASVFASGISSPTGIAKVGTALYVLSSTNNSLVKIDTATSQLTTVARGFNNPFGLAYDSTRDCFYVSNPGNGTIVRVNRNTGAASTVLTGATQAYGISYLNNRLYLRSGQQVISYDVTNFANPTVSYESVMQSNQGIAKDTSASANTGSYYIASGANRILRVVGETGSGSFGSTSATNRVVVFKDGDPNLNNPRDVAVDAAGKVWVANQFAPGRLTVYNPNGTAFSTPTITTNVSNPLGIAFDGTKIWVANHDAATVTSYDSAGNYVSSLGTGTDHPRNLCFYGGAMYLATDEGIGRIANYATAPVYSRLNSNLAGYNDIEADGGGIYVLAGGGRKLAWDLTTDTAWYSNYHGPNFFWRDSAGEFWMTDSLRFTRYGMGYYNYRLMGVADWISGPRLAGVDSNGNVYLNALSICASEVTNRLKNGPPREEWSYHVDGATCWVPMTGAYCYDALGNFYISTYNGLTVKKVDSTGAAVTLGGSGVGSNHTTYGAWVESDGSALYQTNQAFHRVERLTISGTSGTRTVLPYGLSSAEM